MNKNTGYKTLHLIIMLNQYYSWFNIIELPIGSEILETEKR